MPQILRYGQQTLASQNGLGPGASAQRGSGMDSLSRVAGGFVEMAYDSEQKAKQAALQKQEEDAAALATAELMSARQHWTEQLATRREQAASGAPDFTPTMMKDFDADMQERVQRVPGGKARTYLNERLQDVRLSLYQDALTFEARSRSAAREGKIDSGLDSARTAVEFRPGDFTTVLAEQVSGIVASGLPADRQAVKGEEARAKLAEAAVMGMIRANPRDALKELDNEKSQEPAVNALEFADRVRLRNAAESEIRRLDAEARAGMAEARESLKGEEADAFAAKAAGLPAVLPSRERYAAVYGAADGAQRYALSSQIFEAYDVASAATMMPPGEAAAALARFQPKTQAGAADQAKVADMAMRLYSEQRKAFEADPAGTIVARDKEAAQAFQSATDEGAEPQAIDAYVNRIRGIQEAAGVAVPQLLPKAAEEAISQQLAPDPEKPGQRAVRLAQLEQQWGKHFPEVLHQVVPKLEGIGQILPFIPGRVAARLDAVSANPKPVLEALQQSGKKSELDLALTDEFADFDATFPPGVVADGPAVTQQYRDAAQLLAAEYIRSGMAPNKAARQARDELIGSQYAIDGSLRIPLREDAGRGRVVDTDAVLTGSRLALRDMGKAGAFLVQPSRFGTAASAQEDMRNLVANDGFWITNGDETGAVLALPDGVVLGADGRPIARTWAELEAMAQAQAAKGRTVRDPLLEGDR